MKESVNKAVRRWEADKGYERVEPGHRVLGLVKPANELGRVNGVIYVGGVAKPVEHYLYRSRDEFNARLAAVVEREQAKQENKAALATKKAALAKTADEVVGRVANTERVSEISGHDASLLLKARLARDFPGFKFIVEVDFNVLAVTYTDGPACDAVMAVLDEFRFGGFDTAVNLAYSASKFLLPGYRLNPAECGGTMENGGAVNPYSFEKPAAAIARVTSAVKYSALLREYSLRARKAVITARGVNTEDMSNDTNTTDYDDC